jgi:hypothetical protein
MMSITCIPYLVIPGDTSYVPMEALCISYYFHDVPFRARRYREALTLVALLTFIAN